MARDYVVRLLNGLVSPEAIVIADRVPGVETKPEDAPKEELKAAGDTPAPSRRVRRDSYLHGSCAAAAMLICAAVVLNVGSLVNMPNVRALPRTGEHAAPAVTAKLNGSGGGERSRDDARMAPDVAAAAERHASWPDNASPQPVPTATSETIAAEFEPVSLRPGQSEAGTSPQEPGAPLPLLPAQPAAEGSGLAKKGAVVGVWAPDTGTCSARNFQSGMLPTIITNEGAWAGETFCMFTDRQQTESGWTVTAKCSSPGERWTSRIRLRVKDDRLTWTSRRGIQAYSRCAPDVLMAQAR